ncbi:hypothetical protein DL765_004523 [Monosporascus sp. GIB2]|nr:hypothetical protein DL765_004523 [Monosporascus sp. GIB2]
MWDFSATLFLFLCFMHLALGISSSDDWVSVVDTAAYRDLPSPCAQDCVLGVHRVTRCQSCGCVCAGNGSGGINIFAHRDEVVSCVRKTCGDETLAVQTGIAFITTCSVVLNTTLAPSELSPAKLTRTTAGRVNVAMAAINEISSSPALSNETTGSLAETSTDPPENEAEGKLTSSFRVLAILSQTR